MALNQVFRVRTQGKLMDQRVEFGVHMQDVTGTGSGPLLATTWRDAMMTSLVAAVTADLTWDQITVSDTNKAGELSHILPLEPPMVGTAIGPGMPPQTSACITLLTGLKGKRRAGRFYLPGLSESSVTGVYIADPQLSLINAVATQLLAIFGPSGSNTVFKLVIYSPPTPPWKPPVQPPVHTDTLITPVTAYRHQGAIRTQRRRAYGVGR